MLLLDSSYYYVRKVEPHAVLSRQHVTTLTRIMMKQKMASVKNKPGARKGTRARVSDNKTQPMGQNKSPVVKNVEEAESECDFNPTPERLSEVANT